MMGSWCSGILSEVMFLQKKREAVIAGEAIRSSKGGYVSRFRDKENMQLVLSRMRTEWAQARLRLTPLQFDN